MLRPLFRPGNDLGFLVRQSGFPANFPRATSRAELVSLPRGPATFPRQ